MDKKPEDIVVSTPPRRIFGFTMYPKIKRDAIILAGLILLYILINKLG